MIDATYRAWKEIDTDALRHNAQVIQSLLPSGCRLMAVVKANAYGHDAALVARCLERSGVCAFAVACLAEGIALRQAGVSSTILILGYTPADAVPLLRQWNLLQTVVDEAHGHALAACGQDIHVHLALDTGMHRLGVPAENKAALARLYRLKHLKIDGIFSHLAVSDNLTDGALAYSKAQLTCFHDTLAWLKQNGYDPGQTHIQASYGLLNLPAQACSYVRAGIALYGVYSDSSPTLQRLDLRPVLSLRARVVCIRNLQPGEGAGYGLAFRASRKTSLAIVSIGYADGIPRMLGQHGGRILLHGQSCPIVGRICMDQLFADVTGIAPVSPGDVATLIGRDGPSEIRAEEMAERCGTITNELLSRVGSRICTVPTESKSPGGAL